MTTFYDILILNSVYIRYNTWHLYVVSEENNDTTRTVYALATDNTKMTTAQSQWETVFSIYSWPAPEASTPAV